MTLWVFAYGSLMWNPEFDPEETAIATLDGWARSFCMWSIHHRGSEAEPGLVLALDAREGAACRGLALRVRAEEADAVLAALRERELISSAYIERRLPLRLDDGREVEAVAFVIDPEHVQYCLLPAEEQARIITRATGGRGPNRDYLWSTADRLDALGIADAELTALAERVRDMTGSA